MRAIQTDSLTLEAGMFKLSEVSIAIPKGKITAIVGPNGSGKSTMLRLISGLLTADSGNILINGKDTTGYKRSEYAKNLSMLTQSKDILPSLTVRELVAYGRAPYQKSFRQRLTEEDERIIDWALRAMRIRRHEDRMFHTLSGGEQQKARIAMALAQQTEILLLDEPTTFLDMCHQLEVLETLAKINREYGTTIVMVLHDLQQAAAYCHYMIAMKDGELADSGEPRTMITPRFMRSVFDLDARISFAERYPIIIPIPKTDEEEETMIIVTNVSQISKGEGEKLVERFDRVGKVEEMAGFLGLEVLLTQNLKEYDEVSIVTRWQSREDFNNWTKSEAFRESHSSRKTPEYILSNKIMFQEVKVKRTPLPASGRSDELLAQ